MVTFDINGAIIKFDEKRDNYMRNIWNMEIA